MINKDPQTALVDDLRTKLEELTTELEAYKNGSIKLDKHQENLPEIIHELESEITDLRSVLQMREQREAEERALRIVSEAQLLKLKDKYSALKDSTPASELIYFSELGCHHSEDSDDDGVDLQSTSQLLSRNSELELLVEVKKEVDQTYQLQRLRKQITLLEQSASTQLSLLTTAKDPQPRRRQSVISTSESWYFINSLGFGPGVEDQSLANIDG